MTKLNGWKLSGALVLLCVATATTASGQVFKTLAIFEGSNGAIPVDEALVQGPDGWLYGTTEDGGLSNINCSESTCGTVFRMTDDGSLTVLYEFCAHVNEENFCSDGNYPAGGLVLATNGKLYGTAFAGGTDGSGTAFEITTTGDLTVLHNFGDEGQPLGTLIRGVDGNFYGTTYTGGAHNGGAVFKMMPDGALTTIYNFCSQPDCADGSFPSGYMVQVLDGSIYGTTGFGGTRNTFCPYGCGTIFKVSLDGTLATVHDFDGSDGYGPNGMTLATNGTLYGLTQTGAAYNHGAIFSLTTQDAFTLLYSFCSHLNENGYCSDGAGPVGDLLQATDGKFYGATYGGGTDDLGTLFKITLRGTLTTLHNYDGTDGELPDGGLMQATSGTFYGTTEYGGDFSCGPPYGCGTIFSLDTGLGPFVKLVYGAGKIGQTGGILGQGFTGTTSVTLSGVPAKFKVVSDTYLTATVPPGATTGYVTVTTPSGILKSNAPFHVIP